MLLSPDHSLVRASLAFSVPFSLRSSVIELFSLDHVVHGLPCVKLHTINTLVRSVLFHYGKPNLTFYKYVAAAKQDGSVDGWAARHMCGYLCLCVCLCSEFKITNLLQTSLILLFIGVFRNQNLW